MFKNIFKTKKAYEPLDYEQRKYFENNILFLNGAFPEPPMDTRKVFTPSDKDFPIKWDDSEETAIRALKIVSENMQINFDDIELDFYTEGMTEFSANGGEPPIFLVNDEEQEYTAGLYFDKKENGKYEISINKTCLSNPESLIGTIAHELSHIKLLGEDKIVENDEYLTDLATVFFGFGIFSANSSFHFFKQSDRWGYNSTGYLKFDEWAYCLALFAFLRYEDNPEWSKHLNLTIKKEFDRCMKYMLENEQDIFNFKD
ncbi:hypothetical protein [Dysgonomonas sp. BGC7]|uniref:hypothetical protein n=1 Tax=Dysgonomonas sp. BGC7 TaxID=1658008 RepID=UPI00067FB5B4|nr:hypothetical protein [Dysgonomonas sp. BGC7]MBD8387071.1 hypothetical protein [Dysgonomonas sp. BGC7]